MTLRFIVSMALGGAAFGTLMIMVALINWWVGSAALSAFLLFYSIIYVAGGLTSLGGYQRAPFLVVRNLDDQGFLKQSWSIETSLWMLIIVCLSIVSLALYSVFDGPVLPLLVGAILVGAQFVVSGIANGLGRFILARINFVVLPNLLFLLLILSGVSQVALLYCVALALGLCVSLIVLRSVGWRTAEKRKNISTNPPLFSAGSVVTSILISTISQMDLWLVSLFSDGGQIVLYAFASRMVVLLTFPVISYINALQPKLAGLMALQQNTKVRQLMREDYRKVFYLVVFAGIIAPFFALGWGRIVFGGFIWPLVWLSLSASFGYVLCAIVPPYETLAYAKGAEEKYAPFVVLMLGAQIVLSVGLIKAGFLYGLPFVAGVTLGAVRHGMRRELPPKA